MPVYPVNPGHDMIAGAAAYRTIADVPGEVELAVIAVPAAALRDTIDQCIDKRVRGAVIITADSNDDAGDELIAHARRNGLRIIGPSSFGIASPRPEVELQSSLVDVRLDVYKRQALHLDEAGLSPVARGEHDDVHVDLGGAVFDVGQVEHRCSVDDADADRAAERVERMLGQVTAGDDAAERVVQGDEASADARRAGAAIGLQHVAVDGDLTLTEHRHVAGGTERSGDQALDLDGATALLALGGLAPDALGRQMCIRDSYTIEQLRSRGVRVAIDDFGIGYSSFQALRALQVDRVKIDRDFVQGVLHDRRDRLIVASVIRLAHDLGLDVVAEGVENAALWDAVAALDCDVAQGYGIAAPMAYPELRGWLSGWNEVLVEPIPGAPEPISQRQIRPHHPVVTR